MSAFTNVSLYECPPHPNSKVKNIRLQVLENQFYTIIFLTGILKDDPTVWLGGARPANTCITPSFLGMCPHSFMEYPQTKYVC
jgi:hypothetical protein